MEDMITEEVEAAEVLVVSNPVVDSIVVAMKGCSPGAAAMLAEAVEIVKVAALVDKLESIDFTSKADILRCTVAVRNTVFDILKRLSIIRKGGSVDIISGKDEEGEAIYLTFEADGFMAMKDVAILGVGTVIKNKAIASKRALIKKQTEELAALEAEEEEEGVGDEVVEVPLEDGMTEA